MSRSWPARPGYDPVLFGYTDTSVDPRTVAADDPRLFTYEGVLPGFRVVIRDPWEEGSPAWGAWLAAQGLDVPADPHALYEPIPGFPGADDHGSTWAPARFPAELSQTTFVRQAVTNWLEQHGDQPFFIHASFIRPHPPRRNPLGYHDLYDAEQIGPFAGCATPEEEAALHPCRAWPSRCRECGAPEDERERRQLRATYYGAQREVDDGLGQLFAYLAASGLADSTLVIVTSDHGEMGGDHWLLEKLGYWDESYHVPLIVVDPRSEADGGRGRVVEAVTESVDVLPTICEFMGVEVPLQADGWSLAPFTRGRARARALARHGALRMGLLQPVDPGGRAGLGHPDEPLLPGRLAERHHEVRAVRHVAGPVPPAPLRPGPGPRAGQQPLRRLRAATGRTWRGTLPRSSCSGACAPSERTLSGHMVGKDTGLVVARDSWR